MDRPDGARVPFNKLQVVFDYLDADFFRVVFDVNLIRQRGNDFEVIAQRACVRYVFALVIIA